MKYFYVLLIISFSNLFSTIKAIALTPAQCNQMGGNCICIAFPGADTVCTRSQHASFLVQAKKENPGVPCTRSLQKLKQYFPTFEVSSHIFA